MMSESNHKDQENILDTLLQALTERRKNTTNNLPAKYDGDSPLPVPEPKGFFARLFDPRAEIKEDYETKRLSVMLETRLKALELEAQGYLDKVRIDQENKTRLHEHEVLQNQAVMKRYGEARAQILMHNLQRGLMTQVAEMGLDPTEEEYLITKLVRICLQSEKENPNGRK
jgi:hypothetical protein